MSENEQKKCETLADIVASMRRGTKLPGFWRSCDLNKILEYHADRIEAAWRREKAEIEADALAVGGVVEAARHNECGTPTTERSSAVGNAAAMRTAIVDINVAAQSILTLIAKGGEVLNIEQVMQQIIHITDSALAAPARNCDKYATADEALKAQQAAFDESNFENGECKLGCPGCDDFPTKCEVRWLFTPAEKGGAE